MEQQDQPAQEHQRYNHTVFKLLDPVLNFSGRQEELQKIHEKLQTNDSQILALCGLGGIGKSEIARKYAMTYKDTYENVIWINSETTQSLNESFESLANELKVSTNDPESIVEDVYQHFQTRKALFVFDNAENYQSISNFLPRYLLSANKGLLVLITSRNKDWDAGAEGCFEVFTINQFNQRESFEYLKKTMEIPDGRCDTEIESLADRLQHFPLAMSQAASYIKEHALSPDSYEEEIVDYLKNYERELKTNLNYQSDRYAKSVLLTYTLTFKKIEQNRTCGKKALKIIAVVAYLAPDDICIDTMFSKIVRNKKILTQAFELFEKFSLVSVEKGRKVSIHRVVQDVIRCHLKDIQFEETVLKDALEVVMDSKFRDSNHFVTVWNYAIRYPSLFDQYYPEMVKKQQGYVLLHTFAYSGCEEAISLLLAYIAEKSYGISSYKLLNWKNKFDHTALHLAATGGHAKVVKMLVNHKEVQTDVVDKRGCIPLTIAIECGHKDVVKLLTDATNRERCLLFAQLYKAMQDHNLEKMKSLWNEHCVPGNFQELKLCPVIHAAYLGNMDIIKFLVESGLNCNETNGRKTTPLLTACNNGNLKVVKYLIKKGSNLKALDCDCQTALLRASKRGQLKVVQYLLHNGLADLAEKDKFGMTPLLFASKIGHLDMVECLLSNGSSVTEAEKNGLTPLMFASKFGDLYIVKFLISKGSDPNVTTKGGTTALSLAKSCSHEHIYDYLKAHCVASATIMDK